MVWHKISYIGLEGVIVLLHALHEALIPLSLLDGLPEQQLNLLQVTPLSVDVVLLPPHLLIETLLVPLERFLGDLLRLQHLLHDPHLLLILERQDLFMVVEDVPETGRELILIL